MEIFDCIDKVSKKYGYSPELIEALKRCVPAMIEGKNEEDINLLMDTLERVQIFTFEKQPKQEEIDAIKEQKLKGRNNNVESKSYDKGEYEKVVSPGSYVTEPVFDDKMSIVDRVGFIYLTNLYNHSSVAEFYGTKINLSHLIHELGHAWVAQKDEFLQEENGDFITRVGTAKFYNKVDKESHTVEETGVEGLFLEEALNSIEEEKALYKVFGISDYREIPGYVQSNYQGFMTAIMRHFIEKLGNNTLEDVRFRKDISSTENLQGVFNETNFMKKLKDNEYYNNKEKQLKSSQNTSMTDRAKNKIIEFFDKYRSVYLTEHTDKGFLEYFDNVMEQLYNFSSIKYNYDLGKEDIKNAYEQTITVILKEGFVPINQAVDIIEERKKQESSPITISSLAREALNDKIREQEVENAEASEKEQYSKDNREDERVDGTSI